MRRVACAVIYLVVAVSVGAMEPASRRVADPAEPAPMPRVSKNQKRPAVVKAACFDEVGNPIPCQDDTGSGTGDGSGSACVRKHKCTGGSVCATGNCEADATANGCSYCSATKCKSMNCG